MVVYIVLKHNKQGDLISIYNAHSCAQKADESVKNLNEFYAETFLFSTQVVRVE